MKRKGMGKGKGMGYKNLIPKDPKVHSQSARGIKQPQRIPDIYSDRLILGYLRKEGIGDNFAVYNEKDVAETDEKFKQKISELIDNDIRRLKKDSDGDGVPDKDDCDPNDPNKQDKPIILPKIQINEIMSRENREKVDNAEIEKFKSKTVSFTDLGYPDKRFYSVKLKGYDEPFNVKVEGKLNTRELNKFKGMKLKDFKGDTQ